MALHGRILVTGRVIGAWEARRVGARGPDHVSQPYEATVLLHERSWQGVVQHKYEDGALALMTTVLEAARRELGNGGWRGPDSRTIPPSALDGEAAP